MLKLFTTFGDLSTMKNTLVFPPVDIKRESKFF